MKNLSIFRKDTTGFLTSLFSLFQEEGLGRSLVKGGLGEVIGETPAASAGATAKKSTPFLRRSWEGEVEGEGVVSPESAQCQPPTVFTMTAPPKARPSGSREASSHRTWSTWRNIETHPGEHHGFLGGNSTQLELVGFLVFSWDFTALFFQDFAWVFKYSAHWI